MFLERQAEFAEKSMSLLVSPCRCHKRNLHSENLGNLVDVDFREDNLQLDQSLSCLFKQNPASVMPDIRIVN